MQRIDYVFIFGLNTPEKINKFIGDLEERVPNDRIDELIKKYEKEAKENKAQFLIARYDMFINDLKKLKGY